MKQDSTNNARIPILRERLLELQGNMSATDFAKKLDLSRQTVGFYLSGQRIPDSETLAQICKKCDVSADWLLGLSNDPNIESPTVDQLGLSSQAVVLMQNFRRDTSCGKDGIDGLSLLIEKGFLLELAWQVKVFCDHVAEDIKLSSKYKNEPSPDCNFQIQRFNDDMEIVSNIEQLIASQYPGYQGRFRIFTGYRYIATQKRELVDDFEKMLRRISGYDNFLTGLPHDGVWL